ncbi:MAG: acetyl-CoA carboxylase carboxyltransferase subunit beta [Coriobacteriia bacterium]|nr:acetyl-CoA carboxylase carboxyltransferase subunit beta [Coriobacteriia bacterium]
MSIADWFKARETKRYTSVGGDTTAAPAGNTDVPDGVWIKCDSCKRIIYEGELAETMRVCKTCGFHFDVTAPERIEQLADEGSFVEIDAGLTPGDPLEFVASKAYVDQLATATEKSGRNEALISGRATIGGSPVVLAVMDFRFIGASMGSVVGEKVTRAFELATAEKLPIVIVTASGGARMQEGMISLMQMAKTSAAAHRHAEAGLLFISILTNPTYGGVTASFAVLGDVIVAEPGAMIGFAGPKLVEQTIRQKLPKGFQTAESLMKHGMVDAIVPREELAERVALLLGYLAPAGAPTPSRKAGEAS